MLCEGHVICLSLETASALSEGAFSWYLDLHYPEDSRGANIEARVDHRPESCFELHLLEITTSMVTFGSCQML